MLNVMFFILLDLLESKSKSDVRSISASEDVDATGTNALSAALLFVASQRLDDDDDKLFNAVALPEVDEVAARYDGGGISSMLGPVASSCGMTLCIAVYVYEIVYQESKIILKFPKYTIRSQLVSSKWENASPTSSIPVIL